MTIDVGVACGSSLLIWFQSPEYISHSCLGVRKSIGTVRKERGPTGRLDNHFYFKNAGQISKLPLIPLLGLEIEERPFCPSQDLGFEG